MAFEKKPVGQTQIVPRRTPSGESALAGLAGAVGDFFGQRAKEAQKEDAEKELFNQKTALSTLASTVRTREKEARLALKTGDYSSLVGAEMASRVAIQQAAPSIVGEQLGLMQNDELRDVINNVPEGGDPDQVYAKWVRDKEKGLTPAASVTFRAETDKFAQTHINGWRKKVEQVQTERQLDRIPHLTRQLVENGAGPADFEAMIAGTAGMMGGVHVENNRKVRTLVAKEILRMMAEPEDKATSIRADKLFHDMGLHEMHSDEENKRIMASSVSQYKQALNVDFVRAKETANADWRAAAAAYEAEPSDANLKKLFRVYQKGMSDMLFHGNRDTEGVSAFTATVSEFIKQNAQLNAAFKQVQRQGFTNTALSPKSKDQMVKRLVNNGEVATAIKYQAISGSSKEWQQQHDQGMLTHSPQTEQMFTRVETLRAHGPLPLEKHYGDKQAAAVHAALKVLAQTQGMQAAMAQHGTILQGLKDFNTNPETFFAQRVRKLSGSSTRAKEGIRGVRDALRSYINSHGEKMGLGDIGYLDLPAQTQDHLEDILNTSSILATAAGGNGDYMEQMFVELGSQKAWEFIYQGGEAMPIPRRSPDMVLNPLGQPVNANPWTADSAARFNFFLEENHPDLVDTLGYTSDAQTNKDGSMVLTDNQRPFIIRGGNVVVDADLAEMLKDKVTVVSEHADGRVTMSFTGGSRVINERIRLDFNESEGTYSLRVMDRPEAKVGGFWEAAGDLAQSAGIDIHSLFGRAEEATDLQSIDKKRGEEAVRAFMKDTGRFWSESTLRGNLRHKDPGVRAKAKEEFARREANDRMEPDDPDAVAAFPGLGTAWKDPKAFVSSFAAIDEIDILMEEVAQAGLRTEMYTPDAARPASVEGTIEQKLEAMEARSAQSGSRFTYRDLENTKSFHDKVSEFIFKAEGFSAKAYSDAGFISIGHGYNLTGRPQAREEVKELGLDYDKLVKGEQTITKEQAAKLGMIAISKLETYMRKEFEGVTMEPHKWMALLSLAYNSKWSGGHPTIIGPRLRGFIKKGDWASAADEIEFKSISNKLAKHLRRGIRARRKKEAALFRGGN